MASPTMTRSRISYIGPVRCWSVMMESAGTADTLELPFRADSVTNNRILAITSSPQSGASVDAHITITSVTGNKPTITINGGAAADQHHVRIWNWG